MYQDNTLELALAAALADPSRQGGLETALLAAELCVLPAEGVSPEDIEKGQGPLSLRGLTLNDGQSAVAAFTRPDHATPVFGEVASMAMRGRHLLEAFQSGRIVLNPGQKQGLVLSSADIAAILSSAGDSQPTRDNANIQIIRPDPEPSLLVAKLKATLTHPAIKSVWVAQTKDRQSGETGWRIEVYGDLSIAEIRLRVDEGVKGLNFAEEPLDLIIGPSTGTGSGLQVL